MLNCPGMETTLVHLAQELQGTMNGERVLLITTNNLNQNFLLGSLNLAGRSSQSQCVTSRCAKGVTWKVGDVHPIITLSCRHLLYGWTISAGIVKKIIIFSRQVHMESTGGNDCIEETDWMYSRFSCYYTSPN